MDEINLIPRDVVERRQRLHRYRLWGVAFAVALLLLPGSTLLLRWQVAVATQRVTALRQQHSHLAHLLDQLKALGERQQQLSTRAQIIDSLFSSTPLQQLFFDMAGLTDDHLWLTRIEARKTSLPSARRHAAPTPAPRAASFFTLGRGATGEPPAAAGQGVTTVLSVQGYTTSTQRLADFMASLSAVRYLARVNLHVARRSVFLVTEAIEFVIEVEM
jgi:Tfp pilus assembly protein PilN